MSDTRFEDMRPGPASTASRLWPMRPVRIELRPIRAGTPAVGPDRRRPASARTIGVIALVLATIGYLLA